MQYRVTVAHEIGSWVGLVETAILHKIQSPASKEPLAELELVFSSSKQPGKCRFFVSGFDLAALPQLPIHDYPQGLCMPMGIGTPPFFQSYDELPQHPPNESPYVSVLLDETNGWIDHHSVGIDGSAMHLDEKDPDLLRVLAFLRTTYLARASSCQSGREAPGTEVLNDVGVMIDHHFHVSILISAASRADMPLIRNSGKF